MKKFIKILGYTLLVIVVLVGGLLTYVKTALPNVGEAPKLTIEKTAQRIERGKYLADHVTLCLNCHSERDWTKFAGPIVDGTLGRGGEEFNRTLGFPGVYYASNITPAGISRYTDGELFRVITTGVTKEGKAIFPVMPYSHYGKMDPEDINCIIAYLRTLAPIQNKVAESVSDFPMNIIINTIPAKATPTRRPDASDIAAYGAYMVNAAGCIECHTKDNHGQIIQELAFSGGREFHLPDGSVLRTPNITPDKETGIGNWSEDAFVNRFKSYADSNYHSPTVQGWEKNTLMPWTSYAKMTREDLAAIYNYLHALPAQHNVIVKFTPATGMAKK